jgi:hypothetical protein
VPVAIIAAAFLLGQSLGRHRGSIMIPILWLTGGWYAVARIATGSGARWAKWQMSIAAAIAVLVGIPNLIAGSSYTSYNASPLSDLFEYGWHTRYVSDRSRAMLILSALCIVWFQVVQGIELVVRRRKHKHASPSPPHC